MFDAAAALFTSTPKLDARILPRGGHNFEYSNKASDLHDSRVQFINSLVSWLRYHAHLDTLLTE